MKAIILAAGRGIRLQDAYLQPKCLVEIGGRTLLRRQIDSLQRMNLTDIVVVVGYKSSTVKAACDDGIIFVENPKFAQTSSLYSLWLAREYLTDGFVVLNSDVLFHPQILTDLLTSPHEDALLVCYRGFNDLFGPEEMKVKVTNGLVKDISKKLSGGDADGENVGIVKFGSTGARLMVRYLDELIENGASTDWAPRAFREFVAHHPLHAISTRGYPWIEIDFPEDYQRAQDIIFPQILSCDLEDEQAQPAFTFESNSQIR
ncbi:MAG: NTP transferase domain-containing protein [Pyrinomonadaceae bacterium]